MKLRRDVRDWVIKAEKYLKAFLIRNRAAFPKTHDLLDLLGFRYPGEFATREEAKRSVRIVSHVRDALRNHLHLR